MLQVNYLDINVHTFVTNVSTHLSVKGSINFYYIIVTNMLFYAKDNYNNWPQSSNESEFNIHTKKLFYKPKK